MISYIVYSNSSYFDVLDIFFEKWREFYDKEITVLADKVYKDEKTILYDSNLQYSERLKDCLEQINDDIVLYQHEDMFLYQKPDEKKIIEYSEILKGSDFSFIRLTKAGSCIFSKTNLNDTLLSISSESLNFFAVQSSLWKRLDLINFLKEAGPMSIWQLEAQSHLINCKKLFLKGLSHFDNEPLRGQQHHDSNVWPYIATAINKGKWNFLEYSSEFSRIPSVLRNSRERF